MLEILRKIILEFQSKNLKYITKREQTFPVVPGKATVITGMRRAGKTSFCYQKMRELMDAGTDRNQILYLNFEDDRLSGLQLKDCQTILDAYYSLYPDNRKRNAGFSSMRSRMYRSGNALSGVFWIPPTFTSS